MLKKKLTALITLLMLNSSVAYALPINYELYTNNTRKSYSIAELQKSFLNSKTGQDHKVYDSFIRDLNKGSFIAIKDDSGKYVDYSTIIEAFLKVKNEGKTFDLNEFIKNANGFNIDGKYGKLDDLDKDNKKDEVKKEEVKSETDEAIHYTREMIWNVMKSLAHSTLLEETDDITRDFEYDYHNDDERLENEFYTLRDIKKLMATKPEYDKKRHDKKEAEIFDLNNFMKFKGLSVKFDGLNNGEYHAETKYLTIVEDSKNTSEENMRKVLNLFDYEPFNFFQGKHEFYDARRDVYRFPCLNMAIWRPDIEKEIVQAVNELRQSKGLKPLEYNVDLHAMGRYCAKRNNFETSRYTEPILSLYYGKGFMNGWPSKAVVGIYPYKTLDTYENPNFDHIYAEDRNKLLKNASIFTLMNKNSGKIFNYNRDIGYLGFTNNKGYNGQGCINDMMNRINKDSWEFASLVPMPKYDGAPNLKESILSSEMTKIGVGSIWNVPIGLADKNGNTGVVIFTSK